jgi:hypothetical protein
MTKSELLAQENASILVHSLVKDSASRRDAAAAEALAEAEADHTARVVATAFTDSIASAKFQNSILLENAAKHASWTPAGVNPGQKESMAASKLHGHSLVMKQEFVAIVLQSRWRARKARRELMVVREQRRLHREATAATRIQSRWRIAKSHRRMRILHDEEVIRQKQIAMYWDRCATVVGKNFRRFLALRQYQILQLESCPYFLKLNIISASDINIGDISSSDPYIVAIGEF